MQHVTLTSVSLSSNRDLKRKRQEDGSYTSVNNNGQEFVVLSFDSGIYKGSRNYFKTNGNWSGVTPKRLKNFVGKDVPAEFVRLSVVPYSVYVNEIEHLLKTVTLLVMAHENAINLACRAGYTVLDDDGCVIAEPSMIRIKEIT